MHVKVICAPSAVYVCVRLSVCVCALSLSMNYVCVCVCVLKFVLGSAGDRAREGGEVLLIFSPAMRKICLGGTAITSLSQPSLPLLSLPFTLSLGIHTVSIYLSDLSQSLGLNKECDMLLLLSISGCQRVWGRICFKVFAA